MSEIKDADLGNKYWCTTQQVRDRFEIEVGNQEPDHEQRIIEATDAMQARWAEATGKTVPDDLPSNVPELLQYATAYEAAYQAHSHYASNIQDNNNDDNRPGRLKSLRDEQFELWRAKEDLTAESEASGEAGETVTGRSGVIGGRSPVYRGDD